MSVLTVENLSVTYKKFQLVKDVSFSVEEGECLCIIGESGSGKSVTVKSFMGLLSDNFKITGNVQFNNENLLNIGNEFLRKMRGKDITMILQNPMTSFDSLYRIEYQMAETFREHTSWNKDKIKAELISILNRMQIKHPEEVLKKYPHQVSGGMLQRIMIGIAIALNPKILIADEPTTAIDAITQYEIMKEFKKLKEMKTTMIFITHDLGVASLISDKIVVMNKGKIVYAGKFEEIFESATDEYKKLLIENKKAVMDTFIKYYIC